MFDRDTPDRKLPPTRSPAQLENMKTQLDLTLLALEALVGLNSEAIVEAAQAEGVAAAIGDRVTLWRLRQASPLRNGQGGRKKLDLEEARSLVAVVGRLAREHQEAIRRAIALLEQHAELGRPPHSAAFLGDYLDRFTQLYQDRMADERSADRLEQLALKLLLDLLFYSGADGARRLWVALFDRAQDSTRPQALNPSPPRQPRSPGNLRKPN